MLIKQTETLRRCPIFMVKKMEIVFKWNASLWFHIGREFSLIEGSDRNTYEETSYRKIICTNSYPFSCLHIAKNNEVDL